MLTTIIKTRNCENRLYECLESVKKSNEIIVVDEHSTDDTIKIANEYKAKVVYSNKNELSFILNQTAKEAENDWILFIYDNETITKELFLSILSYIEKPKRNKNALTLPQKLIYLNKEIKSQRNKKVLRVFRKDSCEFKDDNSGQIVLKNGKLHKFNKGFNPKKGFILNHKKAMLEEISEVLEKNWLKVKNSENKGCSIFFKPLFKFLYLYIWNLGILDGRGGYIYSLQQAIDYFNYECSVLERKERAENDL